MVGFGLDTEPETENLLRIRPAPRCPGPTILGSGSKSRVSDPYSFFMDPDPDPVDPDGGQYGSGSNPDPGL